MFVLINMGMVNTELSSCSCQYELLSTKIIETTTSLISRTSNEVIEGGGGNEGAGSELGSSPNSEVLGSSAPNTIGTGMSFAKVKSLAIKN